MGGVENIYQPLCGQTSWNDSFQTITISFKHSASSMKFAFYCLLDQGVTDEDCGFRELTITTYNCSSLCSLCSDGTSEANNCTQCLNESCLVDNLGLCPEMYFPNPNTGGFSCSSCFIPCTSCTSAAFLNCTSCIEHYAL